MTRGEKMIWAAAYAAEWVRQHGREQNTGIKMCMTEAVENASAAVADARGCKLEVAEAFGQNSDVFTMLDEALTD